MFRRKIAVALVATLALLALAVIAVNSMRIGQIDAVWGLVDEGVVDPGNQFPDGADCLRYGDGPVGSNTDPNVFNLYTGIETMLENPGVQNLDDTNWNQVRFGMPASIYYEYTGYTYEYPYNPACWENQTDYSQNTYFKYQSGLAFKGIPAVTPISVRPNIDPLEPFPIGKFCHINNTVWVSNQLNRTSSTITIKEVDCGENGTLVANLAGDPLPGNQQSKTLEYFVPIQFDETVNQGNKEDCPYPTTGEPCSDAVIPSAPEGQHFYCKFDLEGGGFNVLEYTVAIVGFTTVPLNGSCEGSEYDPSLYMPGFFISEEGATNCACIWAAITDQEPLAVQMNFFEANGEQESIVLRWQTAFETDNMGFNIYRSESLLREDAIRLNNNMISSLVPPGSTFGADYEFVDKSAQPYRRYFYWIEDVDVNGTLTEHGPISAEWTD